jgi:hypothetical protein
MSGDLGVTIFRAIAGLIDLQRCSEPEGYRIFTIG